MKPPKPLKEAVDSFLQAHNDLASSTKRKYERVTAVFCEFAQDRDANHVTDVSVELLDSFRASREIGQLTWAKELPILRQFFSHCADRGWTTENPAKRLKLARNIKPKPVEPFTQEELARIISASKAIGRGEYERLRAYAMALLFRYTALRISDVAVLAKARVSDGEIFVRAEKNGKPVRLPVPGDLMSALASISTRNNLVTGMAC